MAANINTKILIIYQGQQILNGIIVVKLKPYLRNKIYVYFELVCPCEIYQGFDYLISHII